MPRMGSRFMRNKGREDSLVVLRCSRSPEEWQSPLGLVAKVELVV